MAPLSAFLMRVAVVNSQIACHEADILNVS